MAHSTFVQVPPQSTGKKVATTERSILSFDNIVGTFSIGDTVTGVTSGAYGTVTAVILSNDGVTGVLYLKEQNGSFVNDENLQVSSVTVAISNVTVTTPNETIAHQKTIICDPQNPDNIQRVDNYGATVNTFTDGTPNFGPFGTLTIGEPTIVKNYNFEYDNLESEFWDVETASGNTYFETTSGNCVMTTGASTGDKVVRTTNYYHHYFPTVGTEIWITMSASDNGKVGLRRRGGFFDEENGLFWEQDGTDIYAVIRSNVSGSVVERKVHIDDFSDNNFQGADSDQFSIDLTTPNIFVIDFQFLGAGRVRFSAIDQRGQKVVGHVFENVSNTLSDYPYMRTASLPLRFEQENIGNVGSTSELRINCCSIRYSQNIIPSGNLRSHALSTLKTIQQADGETLVAAYRPATTYKGQTNRVITKVLRLMFNNVDTGDSAPVLFKARVAADSSGFTDSTFALSSPIGCTEVATDGTNWPVVSSTQGSFFCHPNTEQNINMMENTSRQAFKNELFLNADANTQPVMFVTAQVMTPGANADVFFSTTFEEIE